MIDAPTKNRELNLGMFGTFDVANYGDLLFPLIARSELSRRLGKFHLHCFSYHQRSPTNWPYEVKSLADLPDQIGRLDGVIIGGGHILRFDKVIARDYLPPAEFIHHPTGYWLTPALIALNHGIPVVWNAPGAFGNVPAWAESLVRLAITGSSYVAVRDEAARKLLQRFENGRPVRVVPDTAFGVARLVDLDSPSAELLRLQNQLDLSEPYVLIQANYTLEPFAHFIRSHPGLFKGFKVLVVATGPILGDDEARFTSILPEAITLSDWPSPLLMAELVGHAKVVVAASLHLSVTALAFGVPQIRLAESFRGKYAILQEFDEIFTLDKAGTIESLDVESIMQRQAPGRLEAIEAELQNHWDTIAAVFNQRTAGSPVRPTDEFWLNLPEMLESHAEPFSSPSGSLLSRMRSPLQLMAKWWLR